MLQCLPVKLLLGASPSMAKLLFSSFANGSDSFVFIHWALVGSCVSKAGLASFCFPSLSEQMFKFSTGESPSLVNGSFISLQMLKSTSVSWFGFSSQL